MGKVTLLGIDIAKNVFVLHCADEKGACVLTIKLTKSKFIAQQELCTVAMGTCGSANHWYRKFTAVGHTVKLISLQFVKTFVKTNKKDRNDA